MTGLADWETEGARARPASPDDVPREPAPAGLRATTWIGLVLLVAAVGVLWATSLTDGSSTPGRFHATVLVVIGVGLAVAGIVALLLRLVAGVLLRR